MSVIIPLPSSAIRMQMGVSYQIRSRPMVISYVVVGDEASRKDMFRAGGEVRSKHGIMSMMETTICAVFQPAVYIQRH